MIKLIRLIALAAVSLSHAGESVDELALWKSKYGADFGSEDALDVKNLMDAVEEGNVQEVERLIDVGVSPSGYENTWVHPLHAAAQFEDKQMVALLLRKGADVSTRDGEDMTPLHRAARAGAREVVEQLLDGGANIDELASVSNMSRWTALHLAASHGHAPTVKLLRDRGAKNTFTENDWDALQLAAYNGRSEVVRVLLESGVSAIYSHGVGALHLAAALNRTTYIAELLLDAGARINDLSKGGGTALLISTKNNQLGMIKLLLSRGADPTLGAPTELGYFTPTQMAKHLHHDEAAALLEDAETRWRAKQIMDAVKDGKLTEVERLIDYTTAYHDLTAHTFFRPLHVAAQNEDAPMVGLLLQKGSDASTRDGENMTALHRAARVGARQIVGKLLDGGARIDAFTYVNGTHMTALHIAATNGHASTVQLLLYRGAKKNIVRGEGWTALQLAAYHGRSEVVRVLLKSGAWAVDYATQDLAGALYLATSGNGTAHTVELLLDYGAGVDHRSTWRNTPLHIALHNAATTNKLDVIKLLLSRGADPTLGYTEKWRRDVTPANVARKKGYKEAAALLEEAERRYLEDAKLRRSRTQKILFACAFFLLTVIAFFGATPRGFPLRGRVALVSLGAAPFVVLCLAHRYGPLLPEQNALLGSILVVVGVNHRDALLDVALSILAAPGYLLARVTGGDDESAQRAPARRKAHRGRRRKTPRAAAVAPPDAEPRVGAVDAPSDWWSRFNSWCTEAKEDHVVALGVFLICYICIFWPSLILWPNFFFAPVDFLSTTFSHSLPWVTLFHTLYILLLVFACFFFGFLVEDCYQRYKHKIPHTPAPPASERTTAESIPEPEPEPEPEPDARPETQEPEPEPAPTRAEPRAEVAAPTPESKREESDDEEPITPPPRGFETVARVLAHLGEAHLLPTFQAQLIDDAALPFLEPSDLIDLGVAPMTCLAILGASAARGKEKKLEAADILDDVATHQSVLEAELREHRAELERLRISSAELPEDMCCPITCELMKEPYICVGDSNTYERIAIEQWFATGARTSPTTNERLDDLTLIPNHTVRRLITALLERRRET